MGPQLFARLCALGIIIFAAWLTRAWCVHKQVLIRGEQGGAQTGLSEQRGSKSKQPIHEQRAELRRTLLSLPYKLGLTHQEEGKDECNAAFACLSAGLRRNRMLAWAITLIVWLLRRGQARVFQLLLFLLLGCMRLRRQCTKNKTQPMSESAAASAQVAHPLLFPDWIWEAFCISGGGRTDVIGTSSVLQWLIMTDKDDYYRQGWLQALTDSRPLSPCTNASHFLPPTNMSELHDNHPPLSVALCHLYTCWRYC